MGKSIKFLFLLSIFWSSCDNKDSEDSNGRASIDSCYADTCDTNCRGIPGQWQFLGLKEENIISVAIDPSDERIIYAGSGFDFSGGSIAKLFKSINCGKTWDTLLVGSFGWNFNDIEIDPTNTNTLYIASGGYGSSTHLLKSLDGGQTWAEKTTGMTFPVGETWVYNITINPRNTSELYAGTTGWGRGDFYKSTNGGETWMDIGADTINNTLSITFDDDDPNTLYVGTYNVYKSTENGESWTSLGDANAWGLIQDIVILPNKDLLIAKWSGVYRYSSQHKTWFSISGGISDSAFVRRLILVHEKVYALVGRIPYPGIYSQSLTGTVWTQVGTTGFNGYGDLQYSAKTNALYLGGSGVYRISLE